MSISVDYIVIDGNKKLVENSLPKYRSKSEDRELGDAGLLEHEKINYGYQTGDRYLPYKWQDKYARERKKVLLKVIIMENKYQKAIFLPQYGMRLYSLFDKVLGKELLYVNPVFQLANLAIRKSWFSGGIEWNFGQLGHAFTTCEDMHIGICKDNNGEEFLRCYEFERCKGVYWNIDFYLRTEDRALATYMNFKNKQGKSIPFYWWTNIAAKEEKKCKSYVGDK